VPLGFLLLSLQGLSELIKRVAALQGDVQIAKYEKVEQ
jgi:TRAP-type mannitol/chloroaromatic compound transport system permease small subunit